jgi:hypothetical protein
MGLGWKAKAERLRMVILSSAHQIARPLPAAVEQTLEIFARVAKTGDGRGLQDEIEQLPPVPESDRLLWEPIDVHGWTIQATMYRRDGKLWWLARAVRKNEREPSEKDNTFLDKVLVHLGADPIRHMVIGPRATPAGEAPLFFGWWTWQNHDPLFDVQVKGRGKDAELRVVPLGSRATDGFSSLDMSEAADAHDEDEET